MISIEFIDDLLNDKITISQTKLDNLLLNVIYKYNNLKHPDYSQEKLVEKLIQMGANIRNIRNSTNTSLMLTDSIQIAEIFLKYLVNINQLNYYHESALHLVKSLEMVQFLLENGADHLIKDKRGNIPLFYILKSNRFALTEKFKIAEKFLLLKPYRMIFIKNYQNQNIFEFVKEQKMVLLYNLFWFHILFDLWTMSCSFYEKYFEWLPQELVDDLYDLIKMF